jgi:hypothetical protein
VLRLSTTMMDFLVARLSGEPNDHFQASVELAAVDVVRRYTRWKHKACVKAMPNQRRVNQVFKHTRVLYGSSMAPGSEMVQRLLRRGNRTLVPDPNPCVRRCLAASQCLLK